MKQHICVCLLVLQNSLCLSGQSGFDSLPSKTVHGVSFGVGIGRVALKNETVSPLIFSGFGFPMQLVYRRESRVSKHTFSVDYQSVNLKTARGFRMGQQSGGLFYSYLKAVKSFKKTRIYVGGEAHLRGFERVYTEGYGRSDQMLLNTLSVSAAMDYWVQNHRFEAQLSVNALAYNIRSGNNFFQNVGDGGFKGVVSSGKVEVLPKYLNAALRLSYCPPGESKHFKWRFDYRGSFFRFQQEQNFGVLNNELSTSLIFQF